MIPIVSIVGKSDSGKTTLIERLIPEIKRRGYRIATVKHDTHSFEIDSEGKDSYRHKKAGAAISLISSPEKVAVIADVDRDMNLSELRDQFVSNVDLIISEGYYRDSQPKIEVFREAAHGEPLCQKDDNLVAFVSDVPFDRGVPCFGLDEIERIADFIEERFLKK
jgi:molybdopterin-guanine dinucleotide biosynthesis protein B